MYKKKIDVSISYILCPSSCQGFATHFHRNLIGISSESHRNLIGISSNESRKKSLTIAYVIKKLYLCGRYAYVAPIDINPGDRYYLVCSYRVS